MGHPSCIPGGMVRSSIPSSMAEILSNAIALRARPATALGFMRTRSSHARYSSEAFHCLGNGRLTNGRRSEYDRCKRRRSSSAAGKGPRWRAQGRLREASPEANRALGVVLAEFCTDTYESAPAYVEGTHSCIGSDKNETTSVTRVTTLHRTCAHENGRRKSA